MKSIGYLENYFNYFTEIEECYRRCRGTPSLLSPIDWALIESWKEAGIPLEAVLNGVERTFAKYKKRAHPFRKINGLAYCTQEVFAATEELKLALAQSGALTPRETRDEAPFSANELRQFLSGNADLLRAAAKACEQTNPAVLAQDLTEGAAALRGLCERETPEDWMRELQMLEEHLSAIEDKLTAAMMRGTSVELLAKLRREISSGLAGSRRQMNAAQLDSLERQFLKKRLYEHYAVPRLSLFYL